MYWIVTHFCWDPHCHWKVKAHPRAMHFCCQRCSLFSLTRHQLFVRQPCEGCVIMEHIDRYGC